MKRMARAAIIVLAAVVLTAAFAATASAYPGASFGTRCSTCHSGAGTNPVATLVSNDGTTATYNVSSGGLEWAVFAGATRIAGQPGSTGQFAVAVGNTYTLFAINGYPGPLGQTAVTPAAAPAPTMFDIMASAGPNGSISPGSMAVAEGADQTYTFTANSGFHVADVLVDGTSVGALGTYTFTNVTADHTISVTFAMDVVETFTILPTAGANGSIAPDTAQMVASGSDFTFVIAPDSGFHVADVLVDGVSVGAVGSYTFTNVTADHTIDASFAANAAGMFTITPGAGAGGSISPTEAQTVAEGSDVTFSITPDLGFHIEAVIVDGVAISTVDSYTFTNVTSDHTIMATFSNDPDTQAPTHLSMRVNDHNIRRNRSIRLSSTLSNSIPALFFGSEVRYEARRPGSHVWRLVATVLADQDGKSSLRVTLTRRGVYRFRAVYLGSDDFAPSKSRTVNVSVR